MRLGWRDFYSERKKSVQIAPRSWWCILSVDFTIASRRQCLLPVRGSRGIACYRTLKRRASEFPVAMTSSFLALILLSLTPRQSLYCHRNESLRFVMSLVLRSRWRIRCLYVHHFQCLALSSVNVNIGSHSLFDRLLRDFRWIIIAHIQQQIVYDVFDDIVNIL